MTTIIDRLQDYTLAHQRITLALATAVVGALAFDAVNNEVDLGPVATWLFRLSLVAFAVSGLGGGVLSASLAIRGDALPTWYEDQNPLFHLARKPVLKLKNGTWRTAQHRFFWLGVTLAALAGVLVQHAPTAPCG